MEKSFCPDMDIDPYPFSQGNKNTLGVTNCADNISICTQRPTTRDIVFPWEACLTHNGPGEGSGQEDGSRMRSGRFRLQLEQG